ncbi:MAG TPA: FAD/NAD(P)-binding protein, partial [Caulobacteraceae bacterium]|nr:FAD/NAD(P)-binding protein [Caulobacteraceae bacterium]
MSDAPRRKIAIVGAGVGAVMLASALAKPGPVLSEVTLIGPKPGRGLAYDVSGDDWRLNTRAGAMSLDACSPSGFVDWLNTFRPRAAPWTADDFVPRRLYGDYLEARLASLQDRTPGLGSTRWVAGRIKAMALEDGGWSLLLTSGERLQADAVVLATGPAPPRPLVFNGRAEIEAFVQDDPWDEAGLKAARAGGEVLIAGMGLSFADIASAFWRINPDIRVVAVSRHGLAPRIHPPEGAGEELFAGGYPRSARELQTRLLNASGLIDEDPEIRPSRLADLRRHGAGVWQGLGEDERPMFVRHFRPYWEAERHRLPPELGEALRAAARRGKLELVR